MEHLGKRVLLRVRQLRVLRGIGIRWRRCNANLRTELRRQHNAKDSKDVFEHLGNSISATLFRVSVL